LQFHCNVEEIKKSNVNEKSLDKNNPESYKWKLLVKWGERIGITEYQKRGRVCNRWKKP